jgi:hypothetical protein
VAAPFEHRDETSGRIEREELIFRPTNLPCCQASLFPAAVGRWLMAILTFKRKARGKPLVQHYPALGSSGAQWSVVLGYARTELNQ